MDETLVDSLVDKFSKEIEEQRTQQEQSQHVSNEAQTQELLIYSSINTTPVESSNIEAIGYLQESKILKIVFKGGSSYIYKNVEELHLKNIYNSKSIGRYFNDNIKAFPDKYECIKL